MKLRKLLKANGWQVARRVKNKQSGKTSCIIINDPDEAAEAFDLKKDRVGLLPEGSKRKTPFYLDFYNFRLINRRLLLDRFQTLESYGEVLDKVAESLLTELCRGEELQPNTIVESLKLAGCEKSNANRERVEFLGLGKVAPASVAMEVFRNELEIRFEKMLDHGRRFLEEKRDEWRAFVAFAEEAVDESFSDALFREIYVEWLYEYSSISLFGKYEKLRDKNGETVIILRSDLQVAVKQFVEAEDLKRRPEQPKINVEKEQPKAAETQPKPTFEARPLFDPAEMVSIVADALEKEEVEIGDQASELDIIKRVAADLGAECVLDEYGELSFRVGSKVVWEDPQETLIDMARDMNLDRKPDDDDRAPGGTGGPEMGF
ncbi:hypothetical protein [Pelagicoccus albus]|uniref:Uncharacterized protein n=1 Tax=Pelagicoccus albus TaxID=415222 RepID=A0A7X1E9S9_9BACT|nr:hypothetical protein [Pelagicoccus albus]MBC2606082.1 hypothetical protein [Pelagicoccus albus]